MKEILQNIKKDIATVEGILKKLRSSRTDDYSTRRAIIIYEDMLNSLYDQYHAVRHYVERDATDDK